MKKSSTSASVSIKIVPDETSHQAPQKGRYPITDSPYHYLSFPLSKLPVSFASIIECCPLRSQSYYEFHLSTD